jgi:4-amino-4-deoxy-L-arabinose transferase-like glycosyltransferase
VSRNGALGAEANESTAPDETDRGAIGGLPALVWVIAGVLVLVLLALAGAYGFHRDEMYFIIAGRHPDFGYVDQPPLTPLLSAAAAQLLGASPLAVRILPAVVTGLGILLVADMARLLGGSRRAQVFAAGLLAASGWMAAGHLDVTATFDVFFWTVALWLLIPILAAPDPRTEWRRWLALGLVMGIALENKTLPVFLGASLAGGVLLCRRWDVIRAPGLWAAMAIAAVIWLPNLVWQAANSWPQLTMAQAISSGQQAIGDRVKEIVDLLALSGPLLFPVAIVGLVWLLRCEDSRPWRALGVALVIDVVLMFVTAGKSYYAGGFIPLAMAAGAIRVDGWLSRGRVRIKWAVLAPAAIGSAVIMALIGLPIVPPEDLHGTPIPSIYSESIAQVGWQQLADQVESVANSLPADQRANAVIVTAAYGQYGALTFYGHNLPPLYSGHNSVWYWGHPADGAGPIIVVGYWRKAPPPLVFTDCAIEAAVDNGMDLPTQEQGTPIWVCRGTTAPWSQIWPQLKHIN